MTAHQLRLNGAPFDLNGQPINEDPKSTAGEGRAMCSCGWLSENLESGGQRKKAHAEHKDTAPEEATPAPETEVEDVEEDSKDATEDTTPEPEAEAEDEPEEHPEDAVYVDYRGHGAAGHFFKALGFEASEVLGKVYGVTVAKAKGSQTVVLSGERAGELAELLPRFWSEAQAPFRIYKRENTSYKKFDKTQKWGKDEAYQAEQKWFVDFAHGVATVLAGEDPKKNGSAGYRAGVTHSENGHLDGSPVDGDDLI